MRMEIAIQTQSSELVGTDGDRGRLERSHLLQKGQPPPRSSRLLPQGPSAARFSDFPRESRNTDFYVPILILVSKLI